MDSHFVEIRRSNNRAISTMGDIFILNEGPACTTKDAEA